MPERVARWLIAQGWDAKQAGAGYYSGPGCRVKPHPGDPYNSGAFSLGGLARRLDEMGGDMPEDANTRPKYDLIVELCAGTAALSWALAGLKFPVSRMGSKAGYSWSILSALGLSVGDMPRRFLWVEPDEELARTLALLTTPGGAAAVAEVIRSWIPCPAGHDEGGEAWCLECATWTNGEPPPVASGHWGQPYRLIERKRNGTARRWATGPSTGKQDARRLWERLRKERPEASPEREGGYLVSYRWGNGGIPGVNQGWNGGWSGPGNERGAFVVERARLADVTDNLAPLPATVVCARAEDVPTPPDCSRVLCYIDPPYAGTTGYAHLFPRSAVVAVARRWAEAGAHVVISEAEPIPELIADGWHFCDIADARIGQRRTFSKQQREVLTSNRPLRARHAWPARDALPGQGGLFG